MSVSPTVSIWFTGMDVLYSISVQNIVHLSSVALILLPSETWYNYIESQRYSTYVMLSGICFHALSRILNHLKYSLEIKCLNYFWIEFSRSYTSLFFFNLFDGMYTFPNESTLAGKFILLYLNIIYSNHPVGIIMPFLFITTLIFDFVCLHSANVLVYLVSAILKVEHSLLCLIFSH